MISATLKRVFQVFILATPWIVAGCYCFQLRSLSSVINKARLFPPKPLFLTQPVDPFRAYDVLTQFARGDGNPVDRSRFVIDYYSKEAKAVRVALKDIPKPFAVGGRVVRKNFDLFSSQNIDKWMKFLGETITVDDTAMIRQSLGEGRIPVHELLAIATPAPFGKGSETVFDTTVRQALEIPADRLMLGDDLFHPTIPGGEKQIQTEIENAMKPKGASWTYKLYKMHLYGPGGKFLTHVDTLHESNHVATVIVGLPVEHEGGSLAVKHLEKSSSYNLSNNNPKIVKYCAFFTDCEHEVEEVTKGWRLVLQYDVYGDRNTTENDAYETDDTDDDDTDDDDSDNDDTDDEDSDDDDTDDGDTDDDDTDDGDTDDGDTDDDDTEDDSYDENASRDALVRSWEDYFYFKPGPGPEPTSMTIATMRPQAERAVLEYITSRPKGDRVALLFRHCYSLQSLQDRVLKGSDSILYDIFSSGKWHRKLQAIFWETSYEGTGCNRLDIYPVSMGDFCSEESRVEVAEYPGKTHLIVYEKKQRPGPLLYERDYIEYTGNDAMTGQYAYCACCMILEQVESGAPDVE